MIEIGEHTGRGFKLEGNKVLLSRWTSDSFIYVQADNFIAADSTYFGSNKCYYKLHFFIETDEVAREVSWDELNDDLRLLVRVNGRGKIEAYSCDPGGYEDDRYYTLEALS